MWRGQKDFTLPGPCWWHQQPRFKVFSRALWDLSPKVLWVRSCGFPCIATLSPLGSRASGSLLLRRVSEPEYGSAEGYTFTIDGWVQFPVHPKAPHHPVFSWWWELCQIQIVPRVFLHCFSSTFLSYVFICVCVHVCVSSFVLNHNSLRNDIYLHFRFTMQKRNEDTSRARGMILVIRRRGRFTTMVMTTTTMITS